MLDTAFGRYTAKDWAIVVVWFIAITGMLVLFAELEGGLGYGVAAVLGTCLAFTRHELARLRRDVESLRAQQGRTGSS